MSRDTIEKFLLKVGRSRWAEDPCIKALEIGTIGEFGIGFLSVFMISDRTIIETRSCLPNEEGIRATIYNWKGFLATEPIIPPQPGTLISLLIKQEYAKQLQNVPRIIEFWGPFTEVPIEIIDENGLRSVLDIPKQGEWSTRLNPPEALSYDFIANDGEKFQEANFWSNKRAKLSIDFRIERPDATAWKSNGEVTSLRAIDLYVDKFFRYQYAVQEGANGGGVLVRTDVPGAIPLTELGFWRMSQNWFAIRDPHYGVWRAVHSDDLRPAFRDIKHDLKTGTTYEQFVLLVLYELWPAPENWKAWPFHQNQFGEKIQTILEETQFVNPYDDEEADEGSSIKQDIYSDERRERRHSHVRRNPDTIIEEFARLVLPKIDAKPISSCITPWDRRDWKEGFGWIW